MVLVVLGQMDLEFSVDLLRIFRRKLQLEISCTPLNAFQSDDILNEYIRVRYRITPEGFQFADRSLEQAAVLYTELSRGAHLPKPFPL